MIRIHADFETSSRAGVDGCFQVISVTKVGYNGEETDLLHLIDQGKHYSSGEDVIRDLGLDPDKVNCKII